MIPYGPYVWRFTRSRRSDSNILIPSKLEQSYPLTTPPNKKALTLTPSASEGHGQSRRHLIYIEKCLPRLPQAQHHQNRTNSLHQRYLAIQSLFAQGPKWINDIQMLLDWPDTGIKQTFCSSVEVNQEITFLHRIPWISPLLKSTSQGATCTYKLQHRWLHKKESQGAGNVRTTKNKNNLLCWWATQHKSAWGKHYGI